MKVHIEVRDIERTPSGVQGRCRLIPEPWGWREDLKRAGLFAVVALAVMVLLRTDQLAAVRTGVSCAVASLMMGAAYLGVLALEHACRARTALRRVGRQLRDGGITLSGTALRRAADAGDEVADGD